MTSAAKALLGVEGLSVRRGEVLAVDSVSLAVEEGTFFVLVGPSGCGKTSLLRAIAGFERPTTGAVRLAGEVLSDAGSWTPPESRQVGMVFQDGALFPHLTVGRNVEYGVESRPDGARRAAGALDLVGMSSLSERYPDELSGGERQRVALARALAPAPKLLLLDEPFASLDAGLRRQVREDVREIIRRANTTAVLVTHDQEEALSLADAVGVMDAGRILQEGAPEVVYKEPASLGVARFLHGGQLLPCRTVGGRAECVLGTVNSGAAEGTGWILVRPEQVRLLDEADAPARGTVRERHFFGHDLVEVVELDGGERLEVRLVPGDDAPIGQRVALALAGESFPVFSDDD